MSPTVHAVVPPPLGHDPENTGVGPDGMVARVMLTAVADPPCAETSMVQTAVPPARMLSCVAWTLTHSAPGPAVLVGVAARDDDDDGDGDGDGVAAVLAGRF